MYGGRDRFWDHEIFPVYLGGSWNFFGLFGWVMKISGFIWVGHEISCLYLGGSRNSLSSQIPLFFFFLNKIFKTQTFPISKATFTWASCASQNCMEAQQLKFTSFVSLCLQQLCSHDVFTRASNRAAPHSRPGLQGAKAQKLSRRRNLNQLFMSVVCCSLRLANRQRRTG